MGQQYLGGPPQPNQQAAFDQWTPSQYGQGIPPELLAGILNNGWRTAPNADYGSGGFGQFAVSPGQTTYNSDPQGMSTGSTTAPSEIDYHPQGQGPGENYYVYDPQGKFLRTDKGSKVQSYASGVLSVAGAALGMGMIGGAGGAAGAADAAGSGAGVTGFGDAGTMYAGADAASAGTLGGGASIPYAGMGAAAAGGGAGGGGGSAVFNPAMDSQLASDQLGITGSQAAADAAAAPIPSVTVNGVPGGSSINWGDVLKTGSKVYGQMAQQNQQGAGQVPVYSAAQDNRPSTFVGPTPGFGPIASQPKKSPMLGGLNNPWGSPYMLGLMGGFHG